MLPSDSPSPISGKALGQSICPEVLTGAEERVYPELSEEEQTRLLKHFKEIQDMQKRLGLEQNGPSLG